MSDTHTEQSQATQLIHTVLEKSPESSEGWTIPPSNKDISIDSLPSSKSSATHSVPQYNFYGLVATQMQTQLNDDADDFDNEPPPNEGSQKENFGISGGKPAKEAKWGMPSPDSRPSSPHGLAVKDNVTMAGQSGTPGRVVVKPKPPIVTFQSPIKSPMPQKPGPPPVTAKGKQTSRPPIRRNNRSHSPLSDDSFAQGDTQLEEEQFLVTSKKFTTPLANLAQGLDNESDISRRPEIFYPSHSSRTVVRERNLRPPVILVPSTPSLSGSSDNSMDDTSMDKPAQLLSKDDSFDRTQRLDSDPNKGSQHSQGFDGQEEVAEVQDLYSSLLGSRTTSSHPFSAVDTGYLHTQEATQVATQEELFMPATPSLGLQTNTSTRTHTGPRSLLNTMDPSKRNRYQHLINLTPVSQKSSTPQDYPTDSFRIAIGSTSKQCSVAERRDAIPPPPVSPSGRAPPSPRRPPPKKQVYHQPTASTADAMDIVPDSEPSRERIQTSVAEERSLDVDKGGTEARIGGRIVERWSDHSEATEDSDAGATKKTILLQEEEEEEQKGERIGGYQVEMEEDAATDKNEEADENDDDDEPLLTRLHKIKGAAPVITRGKGPHAGRNYGSKSKVLVSPPRQSPNSDVKLPQIERRTKKTEHSGSVRAQKGRQVPKNIKIGPKDISHQDAVPSSVPDQDHSRPVRSRKPSLKAATASKDKGKQPQHRSSRATSIARSSRSGRSATVENEDVEMDKLSDGGRSTEIGMDEEMSEEEDEGEEYMEPEVLQLKRKRGRPPKSKSLNQTLVTPRTRLNKRLKSAGSTMSRMNATRVFAIWQRNGLWYSGIVYEHNCDNNYNVKFDDGFEKIVSTDDMRAHNLRVGDLVRFKNKDHKVVKVNHKGETVFIDIDGEVEELGFKDISVATKEIKSAWQDRVIDSRNVVPCIRYTDSKVKPAPSPSRSVGSFLSISNPKGPRQSYKFLQQVGLIVSLSGNNTTDKTKDGKSRSDILGAVRDSGGVLVDDLFKYLKMDISYSPNRWVIDYDVAHWCGQPKELQRLFLLADDCNLKPKYLMALALGVPCLSVNWLYACLDAGKELDWRPYLLPQGRPTVFDVMPSQQVNLSWGEQPEHLINIMSNPVASKLLEGQSVLCVGSDMTPRSRDSDKAGEAASYIVRIILAMGASRVEAVRDAASASNPLSHYDLLILREKEQYNRNFIQIHTVDWNWVKDSLIMSRRLTFPSWSVEDDSQCSQSL